MSRWRAASIHLGLSVCVFLSALTLMLTLWYPHPYFEAIGADGMLRLLVCVDVVLGPLITLIIFKSGKKGLKFDLAFIALAQSAALIYGLWVVALARPVFVTFAVDRFKVVSASDVDLSGASPEFARPSWTGPVMAALEFPTESKARNDLMFESVLGGVEAETLARLYRPYAPAAAQAAAKGKPIQALESAHPEAGKEIATFLEKRGKRADQVVYLPLVARGRDMAMIVNRADGAVLGAVAVNPW